MVAKHHVHDPCSLHLLQKSLYRLFDLLQRKIKHRLFHSTSKVVGPLTNGIQAANEGRTEEAWKNAGYVVFDVVTFGAAGPGLRVAAAVGTAVVKTAVNEATHDHHKEKRRSG